MLASSSQLQSRMAGVEHLDERLEGHQKKYITEAMRCGNTSVLEVLLNPHRYITGKPKSKISYWPSAILQDVADHGLLTSQAILLCS